MNFAVVNLGCKVNRVESDDVAAHLAARGAETPEADADLIVVNTCTVTGEAEKKTRKAVRRALRANDRARVVVTGCAAAIDRAFYENLDERVTVLGKAELGKLWEHDGGPAAAPCDGGPAPAPHGAAGELAGPASTRAAQGGGGAARGVGPVSSPHGAAGVLAAQGGVGAAARGTEVPSSLLRFGPSFRSRVGVKVQDGCDNACTYCIVHVARGRATSRPADDVVAECVAYARAGAGEIVLTGINLGSYCDGAKRDPAAVRLADLLHLLLDATAHAACRFRISSVEPRDVDDALVDVLAASDGRVCRHLHLPLQAGSSKVLREMARPYDAPRFVALVERLYAAVPELALSTDIIAGFPGETDAEFQETLDVARACRFAKIHAFPYSRRDGTPAAARADQMPPAVRERRAAALRALGDELRAQEYARRVGTVERVLVESRGRGTTESYFEIPVPPDAQPGTLRELVLPPAENSEG
ncbi:MiaB/RimO family radical SAM methylthiotransferase [Eggerthella sinensis]|uniref:MiaB/RimO family radical SAM methylthiotransferase n=1 Tax=Eggerthella sinensis TaxID=242230 RepID=UPI00248D5335|nr:MiaB/RimO family radical SAM methylthiotransferase [Eggerthella sinensis]